MNQGNLYSTDEEHRFKRFRKTNGYANMPLDGLWLRGPYLHNGSVPTVMDLLSASSERPRIFYRGNDIIDQQDLGFVSDTPVAYGRELFLMDVSIDGNGNRGHEGYQYGTELNEQEKRALIEYLKTF